MIPFTISSSDMCVDGEYIYQKVFARLCAVYVCCVDQDSFCSSIFFYFRIRTQRCGKKIKEDEEKTKCVTKDRTAATQSFGKVFGASSDSILYIHSTLC